jgi:predicted Fe-S protein YdhL (DUF1289 family)
MPARHEAARIVPQADPVLSPCTKVCVLDPDSGYCLGCWRTRAEIAAWSSLSGDERRRIMSGLAGRRIEAASGG